MFATRPRAPLSNIRGQEGHKTALLPAILATKPNPIIPGAETSGRVADARSALQGSLSREPCRAAVWVASVAAGEGKTETFPDRLGSFLSLGNPRRLSLGYAFCDSPSLSSSFFASASAWPTENMRNQRWSETRNAASSHFDV